MLAEGEMLVALDIPFLALLVREVQVVDSPVQVVKQQTEVCMRVEKQLEVVNRQVERQLVVISDTRAVAETEKVSSRRKKRLLEGFDKGVGR